MHANLVADPLPRSGAFQGMTVDILRDMLANAGNPRALGELVTRAMRDLTGARSVVLLQCLEDFGGSGHRVVSFDPARRRALAESAEMQDLAELTHRLDGPIVWLPGERQGEAEAILDRLEAGLSIGAPLNVGAVKVGCLLILDLPERRGTGLVVETLEMLATVIALAFRNSLLFERQEAVIEERTRALRESEQQLRQQQKLESIGTLAGGLAHEINNPINGVMNYAQLILDKHGEDDPAATYAHEIIRETERVAAIVRNLLTFARHDQQAHSPADLAHLIETTLSLIRTVVRRDQITLEVDLPDDLPMVKCRSQQIRQVLMNLLTNARDAVDERYPGYDPDKVIRISAALFEQEGERWVRTTVEDHGVGIPPDVQERIFDPFFTTKGRDRGSGLGLSISHGIVQEHGGRLHFETESDTLTRFHLDLPVDNGWRLDEQPDADGREE